jgi:DNA-binding LacI/PurR family transcriptional regulator
MTMSIEARLDMANYVSLLCNTSEMVSKQERLLSTMQEYSADGILLSPARGTSMATIEKLKVLDCLFCSLDVMSPAFRQITWVQITLLGQALQWNT